MLRHRTCRGSETKEITSFLLAFFTKMFSDGCALSPYLLGDHAICAGLISEPLKLAYFFWPFSFGPPFAKSQKIRDLGVLAKFTIAQLCEHFLEPPFVLKCSPILRDRNVIYPVVSFDHINEN